MSSYKIALLDGDGIGPEIMIEAVKILKLVAERNNVSFELSTRHLVPVHGLKQAFLSPTLRKRFVMKQMPF